MEVSVGEARALKDMMEMLSSARMGEEKSAREKFLDSIQKSEGLHSMLEFARSKGLVKEEYTGEGNAFVGAQVGLKKGDKFQVKGKGKVFTKGATGGRLVTFWVDHGGRGSPRRPYVINSSSDKHIRGGSCEFVNGVPHPRNSPK